MGCTLHFGIDNCLAVEPKKHDRQFNHMYFCRLCELSEPIKRILPLDDNTQIKKIMDLRIGETCYVIGISILEKLPGKSKIFIEDDSAKICIDSVEMPFLTTGLCIGLKGCLSNESIFIVSNYFLPGSPIATQPSFFADGTLMVSGLSSNFDMDIFLEVCRLYSAKVLQNHLCF